MKTFSAKPAEVKRDWFVVDAERGSAELALSVLDGWQGSGVASRLMEAIVVTTTLQLRSASNWAAVGFPISTPTTGLSTSVTMPNFLRSPYSLNLSAVCCRRASVGTMTKMRSPRDSTVMASMTSVLPVPVGITMMAGSLLKLQCAAIAWSAPI